MFDCYIHLCAFVYSLANPEYPFVVSMDDKNYVPLKHKVTTDDRSIKDCVLNLIDECIDRNPANINLFFIDILLDNTDINIYYTCVLPIDSEIHIGHKISAQLLINNALVRRAIRYV